MGEGLHSNLKDKIEDVGGIFNPLDPHPMPHEEEGREEYITYQYKYKCKHCGYEWTEEKAKDKPV